MIRGLDVSAAQGVLTEADWSAIAAMGCRFAFVKCAEGNKAGADGQCAGNVTRARAAGLAVGAYLFAYPLPPAPGIDGRAPAAQAAHHHALALSSGLAKGVGELPPALDLEWPPPDTWAKWGCTAEQIRAWALDYLDAAEPLWGIRPLVYTYPDFWTRLGGAGEPRFGNSLLWSASYTVNGWPVEGQRPVIERPWTSWAFWQWSGGSHRLPDGRPVDLDAFNGDEAALEKLCAWAAPAAPVADMHPLFVPPDPLKPEPPDEVA